jgi:murein L,D-transpeptidase YafK
MDDGPIERIIIRKQARLLTARVAGGRELGYSVALGRNWAADKSVEGDEATPVGEFYICAKNPRSRFFLSLCISYPNAEDAERGLSAGIITPAEHAAILDAIRRGVMPPQRTRLGGEIYIHGEDPHPPPAGGGSAGTRGCICLANTSMREIYQRTALGTPVLITP